MKSKDVCFKGICAVDKERCQCNMIKFLPSGFLWDSQKSNFLTRRERANSSSLVNFAIFIGGMYYETLNNVVYPALREHRPETAVTSLDEWLLSFGWNYNALSKYDFSPDGLFVREAITEDGIKKIARSKLDLSLYSIALKSAIVRVLDNGVALFSGLNVERLNLLLTPFRVKVVYSEQPPKSNYRQLREKIFLVPDHPLALSVPARTCHGEDKIVNFERLIATDLGQPFSGEDLLLDVALVTAKKILRED